MIRDAIGRGHFLDGGFTKFLWLLLILFVPILGMLIYFIARHSYVELTERSMV